jgi:hypothetical protein
VVSGYQCSSSHGNSYGRQQKERVLALSVLAFERKQGRDRRLVLY